MIIAALYYCSGGTRARIHKCDGSREIRTAITYASNPSGFFLSVALAGAGGKKVRKRRDRAGEAEKKTNELRTTIILFISFETKKKKRARTMIINYDGLFLGGRTRWSKKKKTKTSATTMATRTTVDGFTTVTATTTLQRRAVEHNRRRTAY